MIKTEEVFSSRGRSTGNKTSRRQDNYTDEIVSRQQSLEVYPAHQLEDLEVHQGFSLEIKIDVQLQSLWSFLQRKVQHRVLAILPKQSAA